MTAGQAQYELVPSASAALVPGQDLPKLALFNANGTPADLSRPALPEDVEELTPITTADATDEASAIALANATKAKVNELIAALVGA